MPTIRPAAMSRMGVGISHQAQPLSGTKQHIRHLDPPHAVFVDPYVRGQPCFPDDNLIAQRIDPPRERDVSLGDVATTVHGQHEMAAIDQYMFWAVHIALL